MTGFDAKRQAAQAKVNDDDDTQVYADTLLIVYQRGFADGKAAQRPWVGLTDEDMKDPKTHILDFIYGARWAEAKLKEKNDH